MTSQIENTSIGVDSITPKDGPSVTTSHPDSLQPLISDNAMFYLELILWGVVCLAINLFGATVNIINMVIFVKTGFKDAITVSLFALAISDFGACFVLILSNIVANPWFQSLDHPIAWDQVAYVISLTPHGFFGKSTQFTTALITFERCLCVTMPLKIKTLITRKTVILYTVACYLILLSLYIPLFYANQIGYITSYHPDRNDTILGLKVTEDRRVIELIAGIIGSFLSWVVFLVIIISTGVLVVSLNRKAGWRLQATSTTATTADIDDKKARTKENRISKMVISISAIFIITFSPWVLMTVVWLSDPRIDVDGPYKNTLRFIFYLCYMLECISSSVNIFFYYKNSSNYRAVFDQIIFRTKTK